MKYLHTLFLIFTIPISIYAQITYNERIEFELKDGYENERLITFEENGLLFFSRKEVSLEGKREWKFEWFDTTLNLVETRRAFFDKRQKLAEVYEDANAAFLLLRDGRHKAYVMSLNGEKELEVYDSRISKKMNISDMLVSNERVFLAGKIRKKPYLTIIDLSTDERKVIPLSMYGIEDKDITLDGFQKLKEGELMLYLKVQERRGRHDLYVLKWDEQIEERELWNLGKDIEENLVDISASKVGIGHYIFTGTYSKKMPSQAQGLFFGELNDGNFSHFKFHDFLSLDHSLIYLSPKKQDKIERKKSRKEQKGKTFNLAYHIAYHDLIALKDGFLSIGEAYHPTYRSDMDVNELCIEEFDGYQYTHAIITKFDHLGNLEWDHVFEMNPSHKPFAEKRFITIDKEEKQALKMLFTTKNKIVSKTISYDGIILQERESKEIDTGHQADKSKRAFMHIDYWYDDYFIVNGSQKIKNRDKNRSVDRKRKVYFLNKLKYTLSGVSADS